MNENQNPSETDSAEKKRDEHAAERAAKRGQSEKTFEGQGKEVKK
jgi:hypothetical protein